MKEGTKKLDIQVCDGPTCSSRATKEIMAVLETELGFKDGEENSEYSLNYRGCCGWCSFGNNVVVNDVILNRVSPENVMDKIAKVKKREHAGNSFTPEILDQVVEDPLSVMMSGGCCGGGCGCEGNCKH